MLSNKYPGLYIAKDSNGDPVDGKYIAKITQTINGVTHRDTKTIYATTIKQAYKEKCRIEEELKAQYENGGTNLANGMRFKDLHKQWDDNVTNKMKRKDKGALSYDTYTTYVSTLKNYILPYFGDMFINNISKGTIRLYLDYIENNYNLSEKTIYNQFSLIRSILNYAYQRDYILFNPCDKVEIDIPDAPDISYFTDLQMKNMILKLNKEVELRKEQLDNSIKYKKLDDEERERRENRELLRVEYKRLFVMLSIVTGARRGEVVALKWSDVELADVPYVEFKGTAYFETGCGAQFKDTLKNKSKLKRVYIDQVVVPYIKEVKGLQAKVIKQWGYKKNDYIFITLDDGDNVPAGNLANGDTYTKWFKGWCSRNKAILGLNNEEAKEAHVHMLRHSSISYLLNNGTDIKTTAEIAGHRDTNMTANRYGHSYDKNKIDASNKFNTLFES